MRFHVKIYNNSAYFSYKYFGITISLHSLCLVLHITKTSYSEIILFMGTKFRGFTMVDMLVDT